MFCQQPDSRVIFSDTQLACPSWSTTHSGGRAALDVDAAFLGFWGCVCPPGFYWGYAELDAILSERALSPDMSLGEQERVLQNRTCLPCPPDLPVMCSPLAVTSPPHTVARSVYPFVSGSTGNRTGTNHLLGVPRAVLPYLARDHLRACLHPAVCGGSSAYSQRWTLWSQFASNGTAFSPAFAEFQCRAGHNSSTRSAQAASTATGSTGSCVARASRVQRHLWWWAPSSAWGCWASRCGGTIMIMISRCRRGRRALPRSTSSPLFCGSSKLRTPCRSRSKSTRRSAATPAPTSPFYGAIWRRSAAGDPDTYLRQVLRRQYSTCARSCSKYAQAPRVPHAAAKPRFRNFAISISR